MKKFLHIFFLGIILINVVGCTGYKPIFNLNNINFTIEDYSIQGDKKLGNQLYYKLLNISKLGKKNGNEKKIYILINTTKNKSITSKDNADKILGYKLVLVNQVEIKDLQTGNQILNKTFSYSSTYSTQDQYSETLKLENKSGENLLNKIYQDLIIDLSENL